MATIIPSDYYISRRSKLLKRFEKIKNRVSGELLAQYNSEFVDNVFIKARAEFEKIIPELPYIGGKKNPYTRLVILGGISLSIYLALMMVLKNKIAAKQLTYAMIRAYTLGRPKIPATVTSAWMFSKINKKRFQKLAAKSQEKQFPGDYVFDYVEGDGGTFDFGLNYTECAICKLNTKMGEADFTEVICASGCMKKGVADVGLTRTTTLAEGNDKCDFRYKKNAPTEVLVPKHLKKEEE